MFATIDPGSRANGGTGLAFFKKFNNQPVVTRQFSGLQGHDWEINCDSILGQLEYFMLNYQFPLSADVWIERPEFMEGHKGLTAARTDSLFKLCCMYGRIWQLMHTMKYKPIGLKIVNWKGQLSKKQVQSRVETILGQKLKKNDDTIDAIGMGHYLNRKHYVSTS